MSEDTRGTGHEEKLAHASEQERKRSMDVSEEEQSFWRGSPLRSRAFAAMSFSVAILAAIMSILAAAVDIGSRSQVLLEQGILAQEVTNDLQTQLDQLDQVESELRGILVFISNQRESMGEAQEAVAELEYRRAELEPLLAADMETVEALLIAQERANSQRRWIDVGWGFVFGFASELIVAVAIAPFVVPRLRKFIGGRRANVDGEVDNG